MKIHPDILFFGVLLFLWFWPEILAAYGYRLDVSVQDRVIPRYLIEDGFLGKKLKLIRFHFKNALLEKVSGLVMFMYVVIGLAALRVIPDIHPEYEWVLFVYWLPLIMGLTSAFRIMVMGFIRWVSKIKF